MSSKIPTPVLAYGVAGLIPFLGLPLAGWLAPDLAERTAGMQALYAALILSFLGGARWGQAVQATSPSVMTVSLAMVPSIAGWVLLLAGAEFGLPAVLTGLAGALGLHWLWDVNSRGLPHWYPRLRGLLTIGAVAGLLMSALLAG